MFQKGNESQTSESDSMDRLKCPVCGKRAADIDANGNVNLALKCPNCHNIVKLKYAGRPALSKRRAV